MPSLRVEILENAIDKLQQVKEIVEKELHYDYSVSDSIEEIIEAMMFDLGETEQRDKERNCE
ncbi:hypothetical protein PJKIFABJ_00041 [Pseudomonas phage PE09]|uniref:Uncharacterized protein n=2 Tax=Otagovirus TaxID=2560197 RepID=A0A7S7YDC7_9CAUD|nr:hypothetical protein QGX22_gp041 [Pseudomonas phage PE09]YP_010768346.1 hypothetical protein QGX23_gp038 [Pseudomonas phage PN09]QHZ59996.1 hypothetical protein PJKIFABJ_00041 [Pseudomonas phage PE09]QPB10459.1 hypothetical protein PN09_038 [Pseudomonas phage PN09]